jgi:hypothetical protein
MKERDMLRAIGGDDFAQVKPKFREQVFNMLDRGDAAKGIADQLSEIKTKYEEYFTPEPQEQPKNTPQFSQNPGRPGVNPTSEDDKLYKQLADSWK